MLRWLAMTLLLVCASACSPRTVPPPDPVPTELDALYAMIHDSRREYERGIEQIVLGDEVAGRNLLAAASDRLVLAARLCSTTPGCDSGLFDNALGHVFTERTEGIAEPVPEPDSPFAEAIPEMDRTVALLHGTDLAQLIPLNRRVQAAMNDWLSWNRPALVQAHENYLFLRDKIAPIYRRAELPEALLFAIMAQESGGKVHAYSHAGAAGPLQFMPRTARHYGLGSDNGFDLRLDPTASTQANVAYLNDLFRAFNNDLEKALAAYNVGDGRFRRLHRAHDGADFWDPDLYYSLPSETRDYVPQVLAAAWLFLHGDQYGLVFPRFEAGSTTIVLDQEISLGELAVCLGQEHNPEGWFRTLRNLNPRRRPRRRVPAGESLELPSVLVSVYNERCAKDSELRRRARLLHDAAYPDVADTIRYTVRSGDTLAAIAARHGCGSVRELAAINSIPPPGYVIHVGQRLTVPGCR